MQKVKNIERQLAKEFERLFESGAFAQIQSLLLKSSPLKLSVEFDVALQKGRKIRRRTSLARLAVADGFKGPKTADFAEALARSNGKGLSAAKLKRFKKALHRKLKQPAVWFSAGTGVGSEDWK